MSEITNATQARDAFMFMRTQLYRTDRSKDALQLCGNIDSMISQLSALEVQVRRGRMKDKYVAQLQKVKDAIDILESEIFLARLLS